MIEMTPPPADESGLTPAMIEAGILAFQKWFGRDVFFDSLLEMPTDQELLELIDDMWRSMRAVRFATLMESTPCP
jgi:hypothetical protein